MAWRHELYSFGLGGGALATDSLVVVEAFFFEGDVVIYVEFPFQPFLEVWDMVLFWEQPKVEVVKLELCPQHIPIQELYMRRITKERFMKPP